MKYYHSPRWTNEILDCSMPMTFDTYNKCSYNCLYCFSYFQKSHSLKDSKDYQAGEVTWVNPARIRDLFLLKKESQFNWYIKDRKVLQWGGLADQFDEHEREHGISLELMKFFKEIDYPICFSTKATWFLDDPRYRKLIEGQKNWNFKVSIINYDAKMAAGMEKGCPSPAERLEAIKKLTALGCGGTTLRLRPIIIGMTEYNLFHLIKQAAKNGATALSTEFLCLEGRADKRLKARYAEMSKILGFDIYDYYRAFSQSRSGYLRLNRTTKFNLFHEVKEYCKSYGLRFYVSDAHFKELCHNGCCCGLDEKWNYSRGQFTEALQIAIKVGQVRFSDISKDLKPYKSFKWSNAEGYNPGSGNKRLVYKDITMYDFFRMNWNNPDLKNSPYQYFGGILQPDKVDLHGDIVYIYKK